MTAKSTRSGRSVAIGAAVAVAVVAVVIAVRVIGDDSTGSQAAPSIQPSPPRALVCKNLSPALLNIREARPKPYPMTIDPKREYLAQLSTSCGTMVVRLLPKNAPIAVNNFVNLAQDGFYTGMVFHRIDKTLDIIQTGDPGCPGSVEACGTGGPGYTIRDEFPNGLKPKVGAVAMTSAGKPNSSGSQFLIVGGKAGLSLPRERTIFGELVGAYSLQVAKLILSTPTKIAPNAPPSAPQDFPDGEYVYVEKVKILER